MARKDVTDEMVLAACRDWRTMAPRPDGFAIGLLVQRTGQCEKVCYRAMERAEARGLIDYGVSLRTAWVVADRDSTMLDASRVHGKLLG